jgi:hypothetical protein
MSVPQRPRPSAAGLFDTLFGREDGRNKGEFKSLDRLFQRDADIFVILV